LERPVIQRGAETTAAAIVEPIAEATGVLLPPIGYLARLRAICHGMESAVITMPPTERHVGEGQQAKLPRY